MLDDINWKKKFSSRKFWAAIVAVLLASTQLFGVDKTVSQEISALVMAVGALVAYILSEGYVDGKREECDLLDEDTIDKE